MILVLERNKFAKSLMQTKKTPKIKTTTATIKMNSMCLKLTITALQ